MHYCSELFSPVARVGYVNAETNTKISLVLSLRVEATNN